VRYTLAGVIGSVCGEQVPGAQAGQPCDAGSPCNSGVCDFNDGDKDPATGTCASRCTLDADCPSPLECLDLMFNGDAANTLKYCRTLEAGGWDG
jgi:hypothetical protein